MKYRITIKHFPGSENPYYATAQKEGLIPGSFHDISWMFGVVGKTPEEAKERCLADIKLHETKEDDRIEEVDL